MINLTLEGGAYFQCFSPFLNKFLAKQVETSIRGDKNWILKLDGTEFPVNDHQMVSASNFLKQKLIGGRFHANYWDFKQLKHDYITELKVPPSSQGKVYKQKYSVGYNFILSWVRKEWHGLEMEEVVSN